ncbi:NUMOD3 motif (2 copies) [compost metagenome]
MKQEDTLVIGVYTIRHVASGAFYFGSCGSYPRRKASHLHHLRHGEHGNKNLQELYCHSPELIWEFTPCDSREEAYELEEKLIRQHWENPRLCNISYGRSGWYAGMMPEETKRKIAEAQTGKVHSDETKALMSDQRRGKKKSTEWVNKIAEASRLQIMVGDVVYSGCAAAAAAYGIHPQTASERARSTSKKFSDWTVVERP